LMNPVPQPIPEARGWYARVGRTPLGNTAKEFHRQRMLPLDRPR
jgi:hypothetical protein